MSGKLLSRIAMTSGLIGLATFLAVILSGTAYPHPVFRIGVFVGLVFIFFSILLELISWIWEIYHCLRQKQYLWVLVLIVLGLVTVGLIAVDILW